jgi:uncharacterized protein YqiB (DUF1249 family)
MVSTTAVPDNAVRRQRYVVDLQALHAECDTNYLRLLKLLPSLAHEDRRFLALQTGDGRERQFQFSVTERARYTATVEIAEFGQRPQWGLSATFTVRLYHDARMAEVLAFQRERQAGLCCDYPNPRMLQPDEKTQWNFLLGEWLTHCLAHGYCLEPVFRQDAAGGEA